MGCRLVYNTRHFDIAKLVIWSGIHRDLHVTVKIWKLYDDILSGTHMTLFNDCRMVSGNCNHVECISRDDIIIELFLPEEIPCFIRVILILYKNFDELPYFINGDLKIIKYV